MAAKRTKAKPVKEAEQQQQFSEQEMADFLLTIPELQEAFTRADIELALDDRGWTNYSNSGLRSFVDMDSSSRNILVSRSRMYWMRDPLAKQAVRLWTDYALGNGFNYKMTPEVAPPAPEPTNKPKPAVAAKESEDAGDSSIIQKLDQFCKNRRNRKVMNSEGQRKNSKKLLIDGEVFFAIFDAAGDGPKVIRRLDPLQITDVVTDPDDDETVLCYRRAAANNKTYYYWDWALPEEDRAKISSVRDPQTQTVIRPEEGVVVYHVAFDALNKRGNGLLFCVNDWSREHRKFMEARVAIVAALAKFAWKGEVQGGQALVNQIKQRLESTYAQVGPALPERNPQTAPAGTWLQNKGIDLAPMSRQTGAGDAKNDSDTIKLMFSAGTGIMLHYFGDPSTGNLATATAMELPMLKMFGSYQQMWLDVYRDIFSIVLDEDPDEEPAAIDLDFPPILEADTQKLATFLTSVTTVFPEAKIPDLLQLMLQTFGLNNLEEIMEKIAANRKAIDEQQKQKSEIELEVMKAGLSGKAPVLNQESMDLLAEAFNNLASKLP